MHNLIHYPPPPLIDAVVHFAQSFYTISEGEGSLRVCASIDVESEVSIAATVYSEDGSAHGKNYIIDLYTV